VFPILNVPFLQEYVETNSLSGALPEPLTQGLRAMGLKIDGRIFTLGRRL
jgi:hypothetical protein